MDKSSPKTENKKSQKQHEKAEKDFENISKLR